MDAETQLVLRRTARAFTVLSYVLSIWLILTQIWPLVDLYSNGEF